MEPMEEKLVNRFRATKWVEIFNAEGDLIKETDLVVLHQDGEPKIFRKPETAEAFIEKDRKIVRRSMRDSNLTVVPHYTVEQMRVIERWETIDE